VAGTVVEGRHLGTALGFPTANLAVDPSLAKVTDGVYAAALTTSAGLRVAAAVSVGVPATFGDLPSTIEAFLLDTPPEAAPPYGSSVTLEFLQYLRPMQAFPNPKALQAAIAKNVEQTREVFAAQAP
jgi:riboflavin kinase/FMN adenylyltransferase